MGRGYMLRCSTVHDKKKKQAKLNHKGHQEDY